MRRSIACLALAAVLPLATACGSLGDRSTVAELTDRCEARRGDLVPGNTAAEDGLRCANPRTTNQMSPGSGARRASLNTGIDRATRDGTRPL